MIEMEGDYWLIKEEVNPDCLVVTTNGVVKGNGKLVMGAGIAKDFRNKFKDLDEYFGHCIEYTFLQYDNSYYIYHVVTSFDYNEIIIALQTKGHWKDPSKLNIVENSVKQLVQKVNEYNVNKVLMTRPGS